MSKKFTEDNIRRNDLPDDAFELIHDLCYDHEGRDRRDYMRRAQKIMRKSTPRMSCAKPLSDHR